MVKPLLGIGSPIIGPAQPCAQFLNPEFAKLLNTVLESMVLEVKPLADAKLGRVLWKGSGHQLRAPVLPIQPHVEMAIVGGPFALAVAGSRRPRSRQIKQTVPVDMVGLAPQQLSRFVKSELLHFLRAERGCAHLRDPDRFLRYSSDLGNLVRPLVHGPVIPI